MRQNLPKTKSAGILYLIPKSFVLALLAISLSGCAKMDFHTLSPIQKVQMELAYFNAESLFNEGRYREAANTLSETAVGLPSPYQESMRIKAASYLIEANLILNAYQLIKDVDETKLSKTELLEKRVSESYFYQQTSQPDKILTALSLEQIKEGDESLQLEALEILAEAFSDEQRYIDSVLARIAREDLLTDTAEQVANTQELWRALISETIENVNERLALGEHSKELVAWLELARLATPAQIDYAELKEAYDLWSARNDFLKMPSNLYNTLYARWQYLDFTPRQIALLLPLTGPFVKIGKAVRDGFMYGLEESQSTETTVMVYNTDQADKNITDIYQQAISEGADLIVGPLLKPKVKELIEKADLKAPVIALNYYPQESFTAQGELFQFGLLPEDEALQIARKLIKKGHLFALVITPEGEWGDRLSDSFIREYIKLGGTVREVSRYDTSFSNYNAYVQSLLRLDESRARHLSIEDTLERKAKFTPRIRNDITAAVIFANHEKSALIYPMIKFYYGNDLPVFASSHIYNPSETKLLRELDGIVYTDIPAIFDLNDEDEDKELSKSQRTHPRLFALGKDAFYISSLIRRIGLGNTRYQGMTGNIELGQQGRLFRNLQWAKFSKGQPIPLGEGW